MYNNRNLLRIMYHILLWLTVVSPLTACVPEAVQHNEAGNEHFEEQAYEPAIEAYKLAQVSEPDLAEPYYNAANAYNRMSQIEAAQLQTEQALKTADPELAAQAWYNLGNAHFDAQQWQQAIEAYQEALRLQPDDQDAKYNLELALQQLEMQQQQQQQEQQAQTESEEQEKQEQQEQPSQDEQQEQQEEQQAQSPEQQDTTPTPESESSESQADQQDEQQEEQAPQAAGPTEEEQPLTEEQALQLLQALLSDSQTLQEYLREIYQVPGPAPEQDW